MLAQARNFVRAVRGEIPPLCEAAEALQDLEIARDYRVLPNDPRGAMDLEKLFGSLELSGYRGLFSIEMFSKELWASSPRIAARQLYESMLPLCELCCGPSRMCV